MRACSLRPQKRELLSTSNAAIRHRLTNANRAPARIRYVILMIRKLNCLNAYDYKLKDEGIRCGHAGPNRRHGAGAKLFCLNNNLLRERWEWQSEVRAVRGSCVGVGDSRVYSAQLMRESPGFAEKVQEEGDREE